MQPASDHIASVAAAHRRRWLRAAMLLAATLLLLWGLVASLFTVDVTQHAVVTRFGAVVRAVDEPGLHVKAPFDRVVRLDRRLSFTRLPAAEYLTVDKRNVVVQSLATWRIGDPARFLTTVATPAEADLRLGDVVLGEIGAVVGTHPVGALIAPDGHSDRFRAIVRDIRERVAHHARATYGIELADVELLQLTLPEQNRVSVFERMQAERGKMAKEFRTAGELLSRKITAEADRERTRIESEAYAKAQRVKAEGDAHAARVYAAAFGRNPAFYKFLRSLKAYESFLDEQTTLFLPADAEVLRVLRPQPKRSGNALPRGPTTTASKPRGIPPAASKSLAAEAEVAGELRPARKADPR
jgi:membrane protease subunit HflC